MKLATWLVVWVLCVVAADAQRLSLFGVDGKDFPLVRGKVYAFNAQNQRVADISGLTIQEDGISREVLALTCPPVRPPRALSAVLVVDVSSSMEELAGGGVSRMQLAKSAVNVWINEMPQQQAECAITSFDDFNYLNQDFTTDRSKLLAAVTQMRPNGGTNYDAALLTPMAGALQISEKGRFNRVVVMLTDGQSLAPPNISAIVMKAVQQQAKLYFVMLGMSAPATLYSLAGYTGGRVFENVTSPQEAQAVYREILMSELGVEPCEVLWRSETRCDTTDVAVRAEWQKQSATARYAITSKSIPVLDISPSMIDFGPGQVGVKKNTTVKVWARNSPITVQSIVSSNPKFSVTPSSFTLGRDQSIDIQVSYTPSDSDYVYTTFSVQTNRCAASFRAIGGVKSRRSKDSVLRLIQPSGGEFFLVGNDTTIVWAGIAPDDICKIEYSFDGGSSWSVLTNFATGLSYTWRNIPKPASQRCMIRITQIAGIGVSGPKPAFFWGRTIGGSSNDEAVDFEVTSTGEYFVTGTTYSNNEDMIGNKGGADIFLAKVNDNGSLRSRVLVGGTGDDKAHGMAKTPDGGCIVVGSTNSINGDVTNPKGGVDAWVLKFDAAGYLEWQKTLGGSQTDMLHAVTNAPGGGYLLVGSTMSADGDVPGSPRGNEDLWVVKLSASGGIQWNRRYGGSLFDEARAVVANGSAGYFVAGHSSSPDGNVVLPRGSLDGILMKLDTAGNVQWWRNFGGSSNEAFNALCVTREGSCLAVGYASSVNGDIVDPKGGRDYVAAKYSVAGDLEWTRNFGGSGADEAHSVYYTRDQQYVLAGVTSSLGGDVSNLWRRSSSERFSDMWVLKINDAGAKEWDLNLGGTHDDAGYAIKEVALGGYVLAGKAHSHDGEVNEHRGVLPNRNTSDAWLVRVTPEGGAWQKDSSGLFSVGMPMAVGSDVFMDTCFVGSSKSRIVRGHIKNTGTYPISVKDIQIVASEVFTVISIPAERVLLPQQVMDVEYAFIPTDEGLFQSPLWIITQSDTLKHTIRGYGKAPALSVVGGIVDFGVVKIGDRKDTNNVTVVRNGSTKYVRITKVDFAGVGGSIFSVNTPLVNLQIQPGRELNLNLRFTPKDIGRMSGILYLHHDAEGSPAKVQLFGSGVNDYPAISATVEEVSMLCSRREYMPVSVSNTGVSPLVIRWTGIKGTHASEFLRVPVFPLTIQPGSTATIEVYAQPLSVGEKEASLEVLSNAYPDSTLFIPLRARLDTAGLAPDRRVIDLGMICAGETISSSVMVRNVGTVPVAFSASSQNEVAQLSADAGRVAVGDSLELPFSFVAPSFAGSLTDYVMVRDSGCGGSFSVEIRAQVINPVLFASGGSANVLLGSSATVSVALNNPSGQPIVIQEAPAVSAPFWLLSPSFPLTVPAYGSVEVVFSFEPDSVGVFVQDVSFAGGMCGVQATGKITGISRDDSVLVVATAFGAPALRCEERYRMPVEIVNMGDKSVRIENIGLVDGEVFAIEGSSLRLLAPMDRDTVFVVFSPSSDGDFTDLLRYTIVSEREYIRQLPLNASKYSPVFLLDDKTVDMGNLSVGENASETMRIKNPGGVSVNISVTSSSGINVQPQQALIPAGGSVDLEVLYSALQDGEVREFIYVAGDCSSADTVVVSGAVQSVASSSFRIGPRSISAYAGDIVDIPVVIDELRAMSAAGVESVDITMSYNPTLLAPVGRQGIIVSDSFATVHVRNIPINTLWESSYPVRFVAGLGNAESCPLAIHSASVASPSVTIHTRDGIFSMLGICPDGGPRLVNTVGEAGIVSVRLESSGAIEVVYSLIEEGATSIDMYSSTGGKVARLFAGSSNEPGIHTVGGHLRAETPSGAYFVVLRTPTYTHSVPVMLVR